MNENAAPVGLSGIEVDGVLCAGIIFGKENAEGHETARPHRLLQVGQRERVLIERQDVEVIVERVCIPKLMDGELPHLTERTGSGQDEKQQQKRAGEVFHWASMLSGSGTVGQFSDSQV